MKKVTAFIGTARKKATFQALQEFEKNLKKMDHSIVFEYVFLNEYHLDFCKGCLSCISYGEELCPLKDDRDKLLDKLRQSDGVIFATPNYAFQVSAILKNFLDRFAYVYHRPDFFGKTFTAIVTQGWRGGNEILKYLESIGANFGFSITKGCYLTTLDPMTTLQKKKLTQEISTASIRFYRQLMAIDQPSPSFFRLMMFRIGRAYVRNIDPKYRDYHFYEEKGWFQSDYYYETRLSFIQKSMGYLFDIFGKQLVKNL